MSKHKGRKGKGGDKDLFDDYPWFPETGTTATGKGSKKDDKVYAPCHESHKELVIGNGVVIGASCGYPRKGYDVYVGFDSHMKFLAPVYPWDQSEHPVIEFQYRITDTQPPSDVVSFKKMIDWLAAQLEAGKHIHMGCIGGHGRTGTVLSALVAQVMKVDDPIAWVHANHCKKAVESTSQVKFLMEHFGCKHAEPSKPVTTGWASSATVTTGGKDGYGKMQGNVSPIKKSKDGESVRHIKSDLAIW